MTTYLTLGLVGVIVLAACAAAAPATQGDRDRSVRRRLRHVERCPTAARSLDVCLRLIAEGVEPAQARSVVTTATSHGITPLTMWLWLQEHDARSLTMAVAADLSHVDLLTHLGDGSMPDVDELALFASANGFTIAARPAPGRATDDRAA